MKKPTSTFQRMNEYVQTHQKEIFKTIAKENREAIEKLWVEFGDFTMEENEDGELVLLSDWHIFRKGTEREDIWRWFDHVHPKGVGWLLEEFMPEPEQKMTFHLPYGYGGANCCVVSVQEIGGWITAFNDYGEKMFGGGTSGFGQFLVDLKSGKYA